MPAPESDEGETKDSDGGAPSTSAPPAPSTEAASSSKAKKSKKSKKKRKKKAASGHSSVRVRRLFPVSNEMTICILEWEWIGRWISKWISEEEKEERQIGRSNEQLLLSSVCLVLVRVYLETCLLDEKPYWIEPILFVDDMKRLIFLSISDLNRTFLRLLSCPVTVSKHHWYLGTRLCWFELNLLTYLLCLLMNRSGIVSRYFLKAFDVSRKRFFTCSHCLPLSLALTSILFFRHLHSPANIG